MKKFFSLFVILILLSSCSQTYYQICKVSSDLPITSQGEYIYKSDNDCELTYDFRRDGGVVRFAIKNNTDSIIYIDLQKSFLVKNGIAYDYFLDRTIGVAETNGISLSANSYYNVLSVANVKTNSLSLEEKPIIAIPPYSSKVFSEYSIAYEREVPLFKGLCKKTVYLYSLVANLDFTNHICYRVGEKAPDKFIHNKFQVSDISYQNTFEYFSPREFCVRFKVRELDKKNYSEQKEYMSEEYISAPEYIEEDGQGSEYTRKSAYKELTKIKRAIISGKHKGLYDATEGYKEISRWYNSIHDIYPEIHNILKEIKSLL